MAIFEVGKKYYDTSACDHNCIFVVEIVKRTAKTVTFRRNGQERRAKIHTDNNGEYIIPERYSMAPVFRASREYVEAPEEAEEATTSPDPVAAYIPQAAQPTDHPGVVMVGQPVVGNWGAMCPMGIGMIVGFVERMATRWTPATTMSVIRWDDGHTSTEALEDIHPRGWRSPSGSPLGVFFAR